MFESPEELLRGIRLGEDSSLELKEVSFRGSSVSGPGRDALADELAAMANTRDAVLVLGVEDRTREIVGIPLERLDTVEQYVFEVCNESIEPPLHFQSFRIELPDATGVLRPLLKVEIPRSLFVHRSPGGYFHRQGSSKRRMSTEFLLRLGQQRSQARLYRFEEQAVPGTTFSDLEPDRRRRFSRPDAEDAAAFKKMKLATDDETGRTRATVAGILMCSSAPERWLPCAFIQAVRYRGVRQDSNYQLDAQAITGPVDEQIAAAMAFVRRNMTVAARKVPGRVEIPQFSLRAVFEAVVNAAAHRDYAVHGSAIRLFLFDDRLELYSPGPLPNSVTVDALALRQSTRNELLTTLLAKCRAVDLTGEIARQFLMEKRGDGVPIILDESLRLSGRRPEYQVIDGAELLLTIHGAEPPGGMAHTES